MKKEKHPLLRVAKHERKRLIARSLSFHAKLISKKEVSVSDILEHIEDEGQDWVNEDPRSNSWIVCEVNMPKEPCIHEEKDCSPGKVTGNCNEE